MSPVKIYIVVCTNPKTNTTNDEFVTLRKERAEAERQRLETIRPDFCFTIVESEVDD